MSLRVNFQTLKWCARGFYKAACGRMANVRHKNPAGYKTTFGQRAVVGCSAIFSFKFSGHFIVLLLFAGLVSGFSSTILIAADPQPPKDQQTAKGEAGLVKFQIINLIHSKSIIKSLSGAAGNPKRGEALMVNRKKGNCIACHRLDLFAEKAKTKPNIYADMGEIGPSLNGIAGRYQEGELRLLLVDAKQMFPDTIMPAFYRVEKFTRVDDPFLNKPILKPQEIEDILSFLMTQK